MHSPWVAIDLAADPVAQARLLRHAHEVVLGGYGAPPVLRELVLRSWERCLAAGVEPERPAPVMLNAEEASRRFAAHPLAAVAPLIRDLVGQISGEARHLVAISDADGLLLWSDGHPRMLDAARAPHFSPGALCSEPALGTNAVGTALVLRHPVQIFSAEHFNRLLHGWTCAAAPVHDPVSGAIAGVIDVSASFRTAHPHTLALVTAAAQAAEVQLARDRVRREAELVERYIDRLSAAGRRPSALVAADGRVLAASPRRWLGDRAQLPDGEERAVLPDGTRAAVEPIGGGARIVWGIRAGERRVPRHMLTIRALGADPASVRLAGHALQLTVRQSELLVVLAMHPAGLSAPELARCLYGPGAKTVSARAETARLRRVVGDLIGAQPYRVTAEVHADFLEVERLVRQRRIAAAVERYKGPLLARSRAPAIVARRTAIESALEAAVAETGDAALQRRWKCRHRPPLVPARLQPAATPRDRWKRRRTLGC